MKLINFARDLAKYSDANLDTVIWVAILEWLAEPNVYVPRYIPAPCRRLLLSVSLCVHLRRIVPKIRRVKIYRSEFAN